MEDEHSVKIVESTAGMMFYWSPSFGDRVFYFVCSALRRIPSRTELGAALANAAHSGPARSFSEAKGAVGNAIAGPRWSVEGNREM